MKKIIMSMGGTPQGWNRWNEEGVTRNFQAEAERLMITAKPYFDECIIRDNDYIKNSPFYKDHKDVLDQPNFGTAFKPIMFFELLQTMQEGDFVLVCDSNHIIISDPQPIIDITLNNGIFAKDHWGVHYLNKQWTLRNTFINMDCDEERYWSSTHVQANIIAMVKNDLVMKFSEEFLTNSLNYDIMFGIGENNNNFPEFREHRHEQSIFSILVEKYKIRYYGNPQWIIPEMDIIQINK